MSYQQIQWCVEHQSVLDEYGQCERMTIGQYQNGYWVITDCRIKTRRLT